MTSNDRLLSEFIDAWNAGEHPRVPDWLGRVPAGPRRDELADLLGTWVEAAPAPPPLDDVARAAIRREPAVARALLLAGLAVERERARLSPADLAKRLVGVLGLPSRAAPSAERHLQRLEAGQREGRGPTRTLLDALARALEAPPLAPAAPAVAFRGTGSPEAAEHLAFLTEQAFGSEEDPEAALDRLFSAGPGG